jgi:ribonuclease-3 family protein
MVRSWLCKHGKCTAAGLHKAAVSFVKASKQAEFAQKLLPLLSEEELGAYKRGRNAKVGSVPKNAETGDYHAATGLETLLGYLYLRGETNRVNELFEIMMEGS